MRGQPKRLVNRQRTYRIIVAVLIPLVAAALQWIFFGAIQPYVWFLFFPAVFFSAWVGGLWGGLVSICAGGTERKNAEAKAHRLAQYYAALSQCNKAIVHCTG